MKVIKEFTLLFEIKVLEISKQLTRYFRVGKLWSKVLLKTKGISTLSILWRKCRVILPPRRIESH